jgi:hypothetical protein
MVTARTNITAGLCGAEIDLSGLHQRQICSPPRIRGGNHVATARYVSAR